MLDGVFILAEIPEDQMKRAEVGTFLDRLVRLLAGPVGGCMGSAT